MKPLLWALNFMIAVSYSTAPANNFTSSTPQFVKAGSLTAKRNLAINKGLNDFPADSGLKARVLQTGNFHNGEVPLHAGQYKWLGLFHNKQKYYIQEAIISIKRVKDDVVDSKDQKTGWEVTTKNADTCIVMISGLDFLQKRSVPKIRFGKQTLLPGNEQSFSTNGINYTLYATGDTTGHSPDTDSYSLSNYKLFIKGNVNGQLYNELLVAGADAEQAPVIIFAGDIDGDNIPDLIIDTSVESNVSKVTLYLSKPVHKGHLLKVAGMHTIVGC